MLRLYATLYHTSLLLSMITGSVSDALCKEQKY